MREEVMPALFLNSNNVSQERNFEKETANEGAKINITKAESSFEDEENYMLEDFSIKEKESDTALSSEQNVKQENSLNFENQENQSVSESLENHIENKVSQEIDTQNETVKEVSIDSSQITNEITKPQNISQNHDESILNEAQSESLKDKETFNEKSSESFNDFGHIESWIDEGGGKPNRPPQKRKK